MRIATETQQSFLARGKLEDGDGKREREKERSRVVERLRGGVATTTWYFWYL